MGPHQAAYRLIRRAAPDQVLRPGLPRSPGFLFPSRRERRILSARAGGSRRRTGWNVFRVDDEGRMTMRTTFRIAAFAAVIVFAAGISGPSSAQVLINELMPDPARDWDGDGSYDYRNDEWIEIVNRGEEVVDLSAYLLRDAGDSWNWRYGFSGLLAPGEALVVYGSDSRAWEESAGFPVYGQSLNNTGDEILLCRTGEGDTVTVDSVVFGRHAADDRSLGRVDAPPGWALFDALNPCGDTCDPPGNGCLPTPGAANGCTTSSTRGSWGLIKRIADR